MRQRQHPLREWPLPQLSWIVSMRVRDGLHAPRREQRADVRRYKRVRDVQQLVRVRPLREYIRHVPLRVPRGIQVGRLGRKLHGYRRMRESSIVPVRHMCKYPGEIHMQVPALL